MKEVIFLGGSKRKVKDLPVEARINAGHQLWLVQVGREPDDWKPMLTVGAGVKEIRIHKPHEYRVIYVAQFKDADLRVACVREKDQADITTRH